MHILFCDDEAPILDIYMDEIEYSIPGQTLKAVANGVEAIAYCKEHQVDLLITDAKMPEMDGIELCKNLFDEDNCPTNMVLITGYIGGYDDEELQKIGITKVFYKPINYDELVEFVRSLVNQHEKLAS